MNKDIKSRLIGIGLNIAELSVLIWHIFFSGPENLFNVVIVWNWIASISGVCVMTLIAILSGTVKVGAGILDDDPESKEKSKEVFVIVRKLCKSTKLGYIINILHVGILGLIAYSGNTSTSIVLGLLFIGSIVLKQVMLGIAGDE